MFATSCVVALVVAVSPAWAAGPGGWDRVGHGTKASKPSLNGKVLALNTQRAGSLYVAGAFTNAGGDAGADLIARWTGSQWSAIGSTPITSSPAAEVRAIAYDPATGKVYAGGTFQDAGGNTSADFLAVWNGATWQPACSSPSRPAFTGNVDALQIIGTTLYVGGEFQDGAEIATADYLLACDLTTGASRSILPVDGAFTGPVYALAADSVGTLYAGGNFGNLAKLPAADYVAAYRSGAWQALGVGAGPSGGAVTGMVRSLAVSGSSVYVGTDALDVAGIAQADHVARWDSFTGAWSALGANTAGTNGWLPTTAYIYALGASGSLVFAGGSFQDANGTKTADMVAFFDGTAWRPIGSDGSKGGPLSAEVHALTVFGKGLYAGGNFTSAGGDSLAQDLASYALRRQDASISKVFTSAYAGTGVYNKTAKGQVRSVSVLKGGLEHVYVRIQNAGLTAASFKVKVTGGTSAIHAHFHQVGLNSPYDVTPGVKAGTHQTGLIAPGDAVTLSVGIYVDNNAGPGTSFLITTRPSSGTGADAVKTVVTTHS
ncbi:hypothetical protein [Nocardioides zhouii]|uniref:Uncharacterized protein n=1 Tax=Nocardioides zhouii TaxID=1168729 RepID=A0A4Q2SSC7_9ACTN|nr:hypothetical protein [Nocardioides zhouii]RYC07158.1 hypothetical protein EUA94_15790 [Nocardioides zhouii]